MAFNRPEAARYLGVGTNKLDELIGTGEIKTKRAGVGARRIVIPRAELDRWLAEGLKSSRP